MTRIFQSPDSTLVGNPGLSPSADSPTEDIPERHASGLDRDEEALARTSVEDPPTHDFLLELDSTMRGTASTQSGASHDSLTTIDAWQDVRRDLLITQRAVSLGQPVASGRMEQQKAHVARKERERDEARARLKNSTAISTAAREIREAGFGYVATNPSARHVPPPPVKGDPRAVFDKTQADQHAAEAEVAHVRGLRNPKAQVLARADEQIDAYGSDVSWQVDDDGNVRPPLVALEATGNTAIRAIPDAFRLLMRDPAYRGKVKAEVRDLIERSYAGVTETATPEEKRQRVAALNARILELQRLEVATVRTMRARGDVAHFRRGLDIRAILSVDGPPPRKQR